MSVDGQAQGLDSAEQPAISQEEFAGLVEMVGADDPDVLIDLLDTYLDESAGLVATVVAAHGQGNREAMLRPVHSLKSSSASVGAMLLSRLCANLEADLRGHGGGQDMGVQVNAIAREFQRVQTALAAEKSRLGAG